MMLKISNFHLLLLFFFHVVYQMNEFKKDELRYIIFVTYIYIYILI